MSSIDKALAFKTDQRVLDAARAAARSGLSAGEVAEQRVSFVFGISDDCVTKDRVRQVILEQQGATVQK